MSFFPLPPGGGGNGNPRKPPGIFEGWWVRLFAQLCLYVVLVVTLVMVVSTVINFFGDLGSHSAFQVLHWYRGAGFRNEYEFGNFLRLFLLAVFVGWAISRFKKGG